MAAIHPYLRDAVFEQKDIAAMSMALNDVCKALNIPDGPAREVIADRIIALATAGERSPTRLRDRVLGDVGLPFGIAASDGVERSVRLTGQASDHSVRRLVVDDMAEAPKLSYRVVKASSGWCWEVLNGGRDVLATGTAATSVKARAEAILAGLSAVDRHVANNPTRLIQDNQMRKHRGT